MKIVLQPYEARTLEALEQRFALERDVTVGIAEDLNSLARLFEKVVSCPEPELKAGRVVMMGLINHVHCLLVGGLQAIEAGNVTVWSNCVRGLIEAFGACVLISKRPLSAPSYLKNVKPGKLYRAAASACPGLGDDVARLHTIVHPASGAIYSSRVLSLDEDKTVTFRFGLREPSIDEAREGANFLGNLATLIVTKFEELMSNDDVLSAGNVIMSRVQAKL